MSAKEDKIMDKINKNLNIIDDALIDNELYKYISKLVNAEEGICELYDDYKLLQQENEKLNHYKLLYQKVKDRNDKAIEYVDDNVAVYAFNNKDLPHWEFNDDDIEMLLEILKGNNETE